ncbi:hypothetical protein [Gordonia sp. (in: high G+C Gram-positive bacteria)]|uniref:hypothetical protein n=1 Tax=Gordonia sp. (in: high G+C Gram-positive bacteria) TaxID=84139 RepID=UPI00261EAC98|nr:hypothetical protein [Gordonia sp. (in: high G+C Gram-positive bacteria)]
MGCNCGSGRKVVVHEAHRADGTIKRYLTEREALADVAQHGGEYQQVTQTSR